jgi:hypothetical protein
LEILLGVIEPLLVFSRLKETVNNILKLLLTDPKGTGYAVVDTVATIEHEIPATTLGTLILF